MVEQESSNSDKVFKNADWIICTNIFPQITKEVEDKT